MNINKVLVVDDDTDIQVVVKMALETMAGWTVELVTDPTKAAKAAGEFQPDVVLLDWMMPEMTGIEVRESLSDVLVLDRTPVIFMTAKVQPEDRQIISQLGAQLIPKPFDPVTLSDDVRAAAAMQLDQAA